MARRTRRVSTSRRYASAVVPLLGMLLAPAAVVWGVPGVLAAFNPAPPPQIQPPADPREDPAPPVVAQPPVVEPPPPATPAPGPDTPPRPRPRCRPPAGSVGRAPS